MQLDLLPTRTGGAAENMAADFLLLQRYPAAARARFRHYDWRAPAFTFGYSQKVAGVREQIAALLPAGEDPGAIDLTRRPTGGGMVDHRDDWTYALVIPRGHALYDARAVESYREIHAAVADILRAQNQPVVLKACGDGACDPVPSDAASAPPAPAAKGPPLVCFTHPERYDVLRADTGAKVAGAAQKRTKHGLLFQGSIARPALGAVDWDAFEDAFSARLAALLAAEPAPTPWPEFNEGELDGLTEHYASREWVEQR